MVAIPNGGHGRHFSAVWIGPPQLWAQISELAFCDFGYCRRLVLWTGVHGVKQCKGSNGNAHFDGGDVAGIFGLAAYE